MTVLAVIAVLIAVNALYVAAEFAAVSVRASRIQQQADRGDRLSRRLLPFVRNPEALDRYIAACQIGITASSLVLGAYGQTTLADLVAPWFVGVGSMQTAAAESTATVIVLIGLTGLQMVLGELIPKSLALQYPTRVARWTVAPMLVSLRLLSGFIKVLNGSGALVLRAFRFQHAGHRHIHSPEELELLITESRDGGMLTRDEHRRLQKALRLGVLPVSDIMVPRVRLSAIEVSASEAEVLALVSASPFTRLPVYHHTLDDIVGLVHSKEVARAVVNAGPFSLRDLIRPVLFVPQTLTAEQLLVRMRQEQRQLAIVVDEFGGTAGLVTIGDVLKEVMGGLIDERQPPVARPERLPDGRVRLPGPMPLHEAEAWIGVSWAPENAHTVGGHVVEVFGRVPRSGERVTIAGAAVEVERVARAAIQSVLVMPLRPTGGPVDTGGRP